MTQSRSRLFVSEPDLRGAEESYVADAVRSTWVSSSGAYLDRFEESFAVACGVERALGTCNGTAALHLALAGLGIGPGDEVIVPSLTYIASVNAVRYVGAEPIFADVSAETWCIDPAQVAQLLTPRTKAVIAVHLYGHPVDIEELRRSLEGSGVSVVEDAAEAPFARAYGRSVGSLGDVATFSFYGNKVITAGEGGAVVTSNDALADRIKQLRGQGMDPDRRYYFPIVGFNYRMTNVAAALLCAQLERSVEMLAARRRLYACYRDGLRDLPGLDFQPEAAWAEVTPWCFPLVVTDECPVNRDELMVGLDRCGIETRPFFPPIHELPPYAAAWTAQARPGALPLTCSLAARGLSLPTASTYGPEVAERVVAAVVRILREGAR